MPPLVLVVRADRVGMRLLPDVGAQRVGVAASGEKLVEDVLHRDEDFEITVRRTAHEREKIGSPIPRRDAADQHPVLPPQGHLLVELLGEVVVDRHQAVIEMDDQVLELVVDGPDRLAEGLFTSHVGYGVAG